MEKFDGQAFLLRSPGIKQRRNFCFVHVGAAVVDVVHSKASDRLARSHLTT
jgi:hypothetical protein